MQTRADRTTKSFVSYDAGRLRSALVVRPSLSFEGVSPVLGEPSPIAERAMAQHDLLIARLNADGVKTVVLDADPATPLGVAAADTAVVLPAGAVLMRPSDLARRGEVARVEAALASAGVPVVGRIEPPGLLDGGDVMLGTSGAFIAVPAERGSAVGIARAVRGNELGRTQFAELCRSLGLSATFVRVVSQVRRLRNVAAFVDSDTVLVAGGAIDGEAFGGFSRIDVSYGEDYGAGVLALGRRRVIANVRFRTMLPILRSSKVGVDAIDLWEFGKVGMTPSTLVLALERD